MKSDLQPSWLSLRWELLLRVEHPWSRRLIRRWRPCTTYEAAGRFRTIRTAGRGFAQLLTRDSHFASARTIVARASGATHSSVTTAAATIDGVLAGAKASGGLVATSRLSPTGRLAPAGNSVTYSDSTGEPGVKDITTVVVSNDDSGMLTFRINVPSLPS